MGNARVIGSDFEADLGEHVRNHGIDLAGHDRGTGLRGGDAYVAEPAFWAGGHQDEIAGDAPYVVDYVSLAAKRNEYGLLNYLNLFVNQQVRTGRYKELWVKWVGTEIPPANLTVPDVYY